MQALQCQAAEDLSWIELKALGSGPSTVGSLTTDSNYLPTPGSGYPVSMMPINTLGHFRICFQLHLSLSFVPYE